MSFALEGDQDMSLMHVALFLACCSNAVVAQPVWAGGGDGMLSGHSGLGSGLFTLAPYTLGGDASIALLSSLIMGPAPLKSKLGVTSGRYISPLDPPSDKGKEETEEDDASRRVALAAGGEASLAALNAGLTSNRVPASTLSSQEEGNEGDKRARAMAEEKAAVEVWQGLLAKATPGPHLTIASAVY